LIGVGDERFIGALHVDRAASDSRAERESRPRELRL
jgi:hypothetical protein